MELKKINYCVDNNIGIITMDYSKNLNAIDEQMAEELLYALDLAENNSEVKVVVLKGGAKAFSAGGDVRFFYDLVEKGDNIDLSKLLKMVAKLSLNMKKSKKMIITSVQGAAAGAGANLALSGDFVICADNAKFIEAFIALGLVPDTGGTYLLSKIIGAQKTMEYSALGSVITAQDAKDLNLVYKVVSKDELDGEVMKLANRLANGPLVAYENLKKQIFDSTFKDYEEYLTKTEFDTQKICSATEDFKEGVRAFIEKRKPEFKGE